MSTTGWCCAVHLPVFCLWSCYSVSTFLISYSSSLIFLLNSSKLFIGSLYIFVAFYRSWESARTCFSTYHSCLYTFVFSIALCSRVLNPILLYPRQNVVVQYGIPAILPLQWQHFQSCFRVALIYHQDWQLVSCPVEQFARPLNDFCIAWETLFQGISLLPFRLSCSNFQSSKDLSDLGTGSAPENFPNTVSGKCRRAPNVLGLLNYF